MRALAAGVLAAALTACGPAGKAPTAANDSACRGIEFERTAFIDCRAEPGRHLVQTALADRAGAPLRDLARLAASHSSTGPAVAFAMNGGMYDDSGQPIGYYVEAGKRLHALNRVAGGGNFGLLPNGVFSVEADGWHVRTADAFARALRTRPRYATQSGPMLVIGGKLHPKIAADGTSLHTRNGVGVDRQGRAHFVISEELVSFGKLARLFRDRLGCPNALYLDGSVSALWDPIGGRLDRTVPLGPLIVVSKSPKAAR